MTDQVFAIIHDETGAVRWVQLVRAGWRARLWLALVGRRLKLAGREGWKATVRECPTMAEFLWWTLKEPEPGALRWIIDGGESGCDGATQGSAPPPAPGSSRA